MPPWDRRDLGIVLLLAALAVALYYPLTLQGHVLASLDALVYFYPHAIYLAERLRAGGIPLWDPLTFAGVPFLANSQVGALYPPNWLYLFGPVSRVYGWLVVGHVWLLAVGTYLLARGSARLHRAGALLAAVAVGFSGFVGGMSGHVNQVEALAWAPFAILLVERAVAGAAWRLALLAALPFALAILAGHSQVTFLTGVMAGAAGLSRAITAPRWAERLAGLGRLAIGPLLGITMAAAQLLPTLELTRQSIRASGLSFADAAAFSLPPPLALTTLLPTVGQSPPTTEWIGYLGVTTLLLAAYGVIRHPRGETLWLAGLAVVGLLLAFGQFTPLYRLAYTLIPGFDLFRVPARWLTLWILAVALLAGRGLDVLVALPGSARSVPRWRYPLAAAGAILLSLALLIAYHYRALIARPSLPTLVLWLMTLGAVALLVGVVRGRRPQFVAAGLITVLIAELAVASLGLPHHDAVWLSAVESPRASDRFLLDRAGPDRILALGDNSFDPGDLARLREQVRDSLTPEGQAESITAIKHVEGLTPNLAQRFGLATIDGYDGGVLPLARYRFFKQLFAEEGPDIVDGRLRIQLKSAPDPRLLGWLNVRYLLMDRLRDKWIDGHYYDLAVRQELASGESLTLPTDPPYTFNRVGVVLVGTSPGPPVGRLRIDAGGVELLLDLTQAGIRAAGQLVENDFDRQGAWLWRVDTPEPATLDQVTLRWDGETPVTLRSLTAIAPGGADDRSITASSSYRLAFLDNMKIYENEVALPRAFFARGLTIVPTVSKAVDLMRQPTWEPRREAVVVAADAPGLAEFESPPASGTVSIRSSAPEHWEIETTSDEERVLVITDSDYPGWRAEVDGHQAPIFPANLMFRGVIIPPGTHQVVLSYDPLSWRVGVIVSGISLIGLALGLAADWRNRLTSSRMSLYTRDGPGSRER